MSVTPGHRARWQDATINGSGNVPGALLAEYLPSYLRDRAQRSQGPARLNGQVENLTNAAIAPFVPAETLAPLERVKEDILILGNLTLDKARANGDGPGDHARSAGAFLTCAQPFKSEGKVKLGISADQLAAKAVGGETRLPSLELGCDRGANAGRCDSGYSCAYSSNISWSGETTPVPKEIDPRQVPAPALDIRTGDRIVSPSGEVWRVSAAPRDAMGRFLLDVHRL